MEVVCDSNVMTMTFNLFERINYAIMIVFSLFVAFYFFKEDIDDFISCLLILSITVFITGVSLCVLFLILAFVNYINLILYYVILQIFSISISGYWILLISDKIEVIDVIKNKLKILFQKSRKIKIVYTLKNGDEFFEYYNVKITGDLWLTTNKRPIYKIIYENGKYTNDMYSKIEVYYKYGEEISNANLYSERYGWNIYNSYFINDDKLKPPYSSCSKGCEFCDRDFKCDWRKYCIDILDDRVKNELILEGKLDTIFLEDPRKFKHKNDKNL